MKLALKKDEYIMYIWKTIENQNKKEKILNFVRFVNLTFDVNLTVNSFQINENSERFNRDMIPSIKKHCFCGLCLMSEETSLLVSAGFVGLTKDKRSYLFRVLPIDYLVFTSSIRCIYFLGTNTPAKTTPHSISPGIVPVPHTVPTDGLVKVMYSVEAT
ncbi:hypothetical protein GLOIN_2v1704883 [Rhizophagus irregularis DAOM 181602=DAOM 197198]|nr:hypothetical protein GLOIN_2v1704883 [Rhizophagus irregularis DAOM 181602=DAOM 197198]